MEKSNLRKIMEMKNARIKIEKQVLLNLHTLPINVICLIFEYLPLHIIVFLMSRYDIFYETMIDSPLWKRKEMHFDADTNIEEINNFFQMAYPYVECLSLSSDWMTQILANMQHFNCNRIKSLAFHTCLKFRIPNEVLDIIKKVTHLSTPVNFTLLQNIDYFENLVKLELYDGSSGDAYRCLYYLRLPRLPLLKKFTLFQESRQNELMNFLQERKDLTHLSIHMNVFDENLSNFLNDMKQLKYLHIDIERSNSLWYKHLSRLTNLEYLNISFFGDSNINDNFFIQAKLPCLKFLYLRLFKAFKLNNSEMIVGKFPLEHLFLEGIEKVEPEALDHLKQCGSLKKLSLIHCKLIESKDLAFLKYMENLNYLNLLGCNKLNDRAIPFILSCKNLCYLNISYTNISSKIIYKLQRKMKLYSFIKSFYVKDEIFRKYLNLIPHVGFERIV